jgi:hypothetical protein
LFSHQCHAIPSRIIMKFHNIATALGSLIIIGKVGADPPVDPTCRVYCARVTDIRAHPTPNKFSFEFEVLNWSDVFVGGVLLVLAEDTSAGVSFARENYYNLNGVDVDGRPIQLEDVNGDSIIDTSDLEDANSDGMLEAGEDRNGNNRLDNDPIPGNLNRANDWTLIDQTATRMEWRHGSPIPFINLLTAGPYPGCARCIEALPRPPKAVVHPVTGEVSPLEAIDNGDNVQDGFVMTVRGLEVGKTIHINWFLLGAGDATFPEEDQPPEQTCRSPRPEIVPVGEPIGFAGFGNAMGFGVITITRVDGIPRPGPVFVGNIGVRQTGVEFFDNVFYVPDETADPGPVNSRRVQANVFNDTFVNTTSPGTVALMAMEFTPNSTACARKKSDLPSGAKVNIEKIIGGCGGEPHFSTWSGERYDFHGECDLVLVQNPGFANGLGMHIHGRTKIHHDWSAFESAAIMIGDDILEVHGQNEQWINGADIEYPAFIGGYSVTMQQPAKHVRRFIVHLGDGERVFIKTFKDILYIEVEGSRTRDFAGADGMLGSFETGHMMGRDRQSMITDPNAFGMEWQVRETDPQLFHLVDGPQYPESCRMPEHPKTASINRLRRNLKKTKTISQEDAKKACANAVAAHYDDCIADVIATRDLDMADAYKNEL